MAEQTILQLKCAVMNYQWGKLGRNSTVAQLAEAASHRVSIEDDVPYAELWMGTHVSGPSKIASNDDGIELSEWLIKHPHQLGNNVRAAYGDRLPFLLKVLSVRTALSIQAHPSKTHAEQLHRDRPDIYKDDNHKPEMTVALTEFHCLCGFRPIKEIADFVENIGELRAVIGEEAGSLLVEASVVDDIQLQRRAIKACLSRVIACDQSFVAAQLSALVQRVRHLEAEGRDTSGEMGHLLLKLNDEFPGDVGAFVSYFLNYLVLQPGQAVFLPANFPHAYLFGDCIECMACSDNVVRAGLTPKYLDKMTLVEMLDYTPRASRELYLQPVTTTGDDHVTIHTFNPPIKDFSVAKIDVDGSASHITLVPLSSASICVVVTGEASVSNDFGDFAVSRGSVFFIAANTSTNLRSCDSGLLIFRAYCTI